MSEVITKNFHIGIKAIIINKGKALILEEITKKGKRLFSLPGGRIDKGEDISKALKRELKEELGIIRFKVGPLIHVFERLDYGKKETSLMLIVYKVDAKIPKIKLSNEHVNFEWVSKQQLNKIPKKLINEGIVTALEKVLK